MKIEKYLEASSFHDLSEIDKVKHLIFYHRCVDGLVEFNTDFILTRFDVLGFGRPNTSRLKRNIIGNRNFVNGTSPGSFKLHYTAVKELEKTHSYLLEKSEDIITDDIILPEKLFAGTRGYIEQLAKQINGSYNDNYFDGCAVLMRRLLEISLIHSYDNKGKIAEIEESGGYKKLSFIINHTISKRYFKISKDSYDVIDEFRVLGNFSAHKIQYNCKRKDIKKVQNQYRLIIEELLYESGIKK